MLQLSTVVAATLSYVSISVFFFMFPNILHKKRRHDCPLLNEVIENKKRVLKIAHRGGSRLHMENTLEGFRECVNNYHPDMLEMDVCFTKDRKLVVHHDSNLIRTCGIDKKIEDLDYAELPKFQDRVPLDFAYRTYMDKTQMVKIPLLEDVFREFPEVLMNVEIKTPSHEAIQEFRRLLKKYSRQNITIWGIRGPLHQNLKIPGETTLTFFNDVKVARLFLLYITGLLPFFAVRDDSLQLPLWTEEFLKWKLDTNTNQRKVKGFFHSLKLMNWLLPPLINHLRKRGIMTMLWVCNTEEEFKRSVDAGCSGIMTDVPNHLHQYLLTEGLTPRP